jgi:hypothetical protein
MIPDARLTEIIAVAKDARENKSLAIDEFRLISPIPTLDPVILDADAADVYYAATNEVLNRELALKTSGAVGIE